jgi:hypothetical protein
MKPDHPYLNPQENPLSALYRLLQQLPPSRTQFTYHEAQLCQAICYHAHATQHIVRACVAILQPLFQPTNNGHPAQYGALFNISILLTQEADITRAMAETYRMMLDRFYQQNPHLPRYQGLPDGWPFAPTPAGAPAPGYAYAPAHEHPPAPAAHAPTPAPTPAPTYTRTPAQPHPPTPEQLAAWLAEYEQRYYFPLGRLLQILPDEITNQPRLSTEQGQMCHAVAHLAGQATATLRQGVTSVKDLLEQAKQGTGAKALPDLQAFLDHCQREADFMQQCREDYDDATCNIAWVG